MIAFRDRSQGQGARLPLSLRDAPAACRFEAAGGAIVYQGDPLVRPDLAQLAWIDLPGDCEGGDWQVALTGQPLPLGLIWRSHPTLRFHLVSDARGRMWQVPAVLDPAGVCQLPLTIHVDGFDTINGAQLPRCVRRPTPTQARLISAAEGARAAIAANAIATLDLAHALTWAADGIAAGQWMSPTVFLVLGLGDDRLVLRTLMALAGLPLPEAELVEDGHA